MIDINRMNALYAATTQGDWQRCQANNGTCQCGLVWSSEPDTVVANCGGDPFNSGEVPKISDEQMVANSDWIAASHNAWPAVAVRLARLELIAARLVETYRLRPCEVAVALDETIDRTGNLLGWVRTLDAEKAGE